LKTLSGEEIAWAAQTACLLEASAEKPGNVSPAASFADTSFVEFAASAIALGPSFREAGSVPVGETILRAVRDTRRFVRVNTNLGLVLLLAPLARAAALVRSGDTLRTTVGHVLRDLTVGDARAAYAAISLAGPGGLGTVAEHDVADGAADITLRDAMALARERDAIAREYVTDYALTFAVGYPALRAALGEGYPVSDAIVHTFLSLLSAFPDTLIARKEGEMVAARVARRAAEVLALGGPASAAGRAELVSLDRELRDAAHRLNPGTTADLTAASLFVCLAEGGMLDELPDLLRRW